MMPRPRSANIRAGFLLTLATLVTWQILDGAPMERFAQAANMRPGDEAAMPLADVQHPDQTLAAATIKTRDGEEIGHVHGLTRGTDGRLKTVEVVLAGTKGIVALDANSLVYLHESNVILTSLTPQQIGLMPRLGG